MKLTVYSADCVGSLSNCIYPNKHIIMDETAMKSAVKNDHVTAEYKDNYRSNLGFICADNVPLDCDNDHSDNPDEWITPFEVAMAFPDVAFVAVYSRNHMKVKDGKSARPRFHVYFIIPKITDSKEYTLLKKRIAISFPYFDSNALDSARLLFGTSDLYMQAKTFKPDCIIAAGGGSVIDASKILKAVILSDITNQEKMREIIKNSAYEPDNSIKIIALPTTSGTGSEVTSSCFIPTICQKSAQLIKAHGED